MSQPPIEDRNTTAVLMNISWIKTTEGIFRFSEIQGLTPPDSKGDDWVLTIGNEPIFLEMEEALELEKLLKPCIDIRGNKACKSSASSDSEEQILRDILSQPSAVEPVFEYFKSKGFDAKIVSVFDKGKRSAAHTYVLYLSADGDPLAEYTALSIAQCLRQGIEYVLASASASASK